MRIANKFTSRLLCPETGLNIITAIFMCYGQKFQQWHCFRFCLSWTDSNKHEKVFSTSWKLASSHCFNCQPQVSSLSWLWHTNFIYAVYNLAAISLSLGLIILLMQIMVEYYGKVSSSLPHHWALLWQRILLTLQDQRHFALEKSAVITISIT